jgi:hypothetical protein
MVQVATFLLPAQRGERQRFLKTTSVSAVSTSTTEAAKVPAVRGPCRKIKCPERLIDTRFYVCKL